MTQTLSESDLKAIADRLERGCPTQGVTLSPWGAQLQADAFTLLREIERTRNHHRRARRMTRIPISEIQRVVGQYYGISKDDLLGKSRKRKHAWPRQMAMFLCREFSQASLTRIAARFEGRDHTTVLSNLISLSARLATSEAVNAELVAIRLLILSPPPTEPVAPPAPDNRPVKWYVGVSRTAIARAA